MKVPPSNAAANKTPGMVGQSTLAATPMASATQARLKVARCRGGTPPRPEGDGRRRGQPHDQPHQGFRGADLRRAADDRHQESRGYDVAETEQAIRGDEAAEAARRVGAASVARRVEYRRSGHSQATTTSGTQRHGPTAYHRARHPAPAARTGHDDR